MAQKYHISPDTGRPNICRAQHKCPIGGEDEHYSSKEEARAGFEKQMSGDTFTSVSKKNPAPAEASPLMTPTGRIAKSAPVVASTVWSYADLAGTQAKLTDLQAQYPELTFSEGPAGELVVAGSHGEVKRYIREPGGEPADIAASLKNIKLQESPTGAAESSVSDWEAEVAPEEPPAEVLEEVSLDDDWSDIKCDGCGYPLDSCKCGECEFCHAQEGEEHDEDCPSYRPRVKAYSWD